MADPGPALGGWWDDAAVKHDVHRERLRAPLWEAAGRAGPARPAQHRLRPANRVSATRRPARAANCLAACAYAPSFAYAPSLWR